jgi:GT2 family glycosyltransferase
MKPIRLPEPALPTVSVVMVTYGGGDWPRTALEALARNTDPIFETVVVDNASPDGAADRLEEAVQGMRLLRNARNEGFAAGAGRGAREARGDILCFLNPDALVRPGWLEPLLQAISRPGVGAAIPRFLGPDGRVQEAGSVVDRRGWTEALGAGAVPADPSTRFPRGVDYGSAACLVISRDDYERAGGFDPAYAPAYCEDVDLAFALREAGLRTLYEPAADVLHAGAGSTDAATRAELIERNRPRLLGRWGRLLASRPPLGELDVHPHRMVALRDALAIERLLVLRDRVPPSDDSLAAFLVETARSWLDVRCTLVALRENELTPAGEELLRGGVEVVPAPANLAGWLEERRFHYSAVLADGSTWRRAAAEVATSQPQAERLLDVRAGDWPGPDAVVCRTKREVSMAPGLDAPTFELGDRGSGPGASALLTWLGAAP